MCPSQVEILTMKFCPVQLHFCFQKPYIYTEPSLFFCSKPYLLLLLSVWCWRAVVAGMTFSGCLRSSVCFDLFQATDSIILRYGMRRHFHSLTDFSQQNANCAYWSTGTRRMWWWWRRVWNRPSSGTFWGDPNPMPRGPVWRWAVYMCVVSWRTVQVHAVLRVLWWTWLCCVVLYTVLWWILLSCVMFCCGSSCASLGWVVLCWVVPSWVGCACRVGCALLGWVMLFGCALLG